jgi:hypothetical protein
MAPLERQSTTHILDMRPLVISGSRNQNSSNTNPASFARRSAPAKKRA